MQSCVFNDQNKFETPPFNCLYFKFNIPFEQGIIKRLIGKDGYYFKNITDKFKLRYVWYNKQTQDIEIWGSNDKIFPIVQKYILTRIYNIGLGDINNGNEISKDTREWVQNFWINSSHSVA